DAIPREANIRAMTGEMPAAPSVAAASGTLRLVISISAPGRSELRRQRGRRETGAPTRGKRGPARRKRQSPATTRYRDVYFDRPRGEGCAQRVGPCAPERRER